MRNKDTEEGKKGCVMKNKHGKKSRKIWQKQNEKQNLVTGKKSK
jgi:hypothetical protein